jgi:hypothetical protein
MVYHKRHTIPSEFILKPLTQNEISRAQHFLEHNNDGIHIVEVNEARSELSRVKIWIEMHAGFTIRGMLTGEIIDENDVECLDYKVVLEQNWFSAVYLFYLFYKILLSS